MWIVFMMILAALPCAAAPVEQLAIYDGCQLNGHLRDLDQTSVAIKVRDAQYTVSKVNEIKSWWGVAQGTPNRMTSLVDLRIGGVLVKIPFEAYADLGNPLIPSGITLTQSQDEIRLNICGGEGSAAYIARFVVIKGKLTRREVVLTEPSDAKVDVMTFD